jgi:predicted phosphate transport protein (TIGR00153 family)
MDTVLASRYFPLGHGRKEGARVPFQVIPRELAFYDLLDGAARNVAEGAGELLSLVDHLDEAQGHVEHIRELEHRGDDLTHAIIALLNRTFVVPFDRGDIYRLATALDDVLDHLEDVADLIELLSITEPFPGFRMQVEVLVRACAAVVRAVADLPRLRTAARDLQAIKRQEREGDWVYRRVVADLYSGDHPAMQVLMWKDLLWRIEAAIDRCEDVANQIETVAAKFA